MTIRINESLHEGRKLAKNPKDILFQVQMEIYEAEEDLKDLSWIKIEGLFGTQDLEELPKGIKRIHLERDCPELLFLN